MYAENARGHYAGANYLADVLGKSKTVMPMNINNSMWSGLIDKKPQDIYNPKNNIEAGVKLLSRIRDRVEKPNASKIGTLWNDLDSKKVNEFGQYIGEVYTKKPWKKIE